MPRKIRSKKGWLRILLMAKDLARIRACKTLENLNFEVVDYPAKSPSDYEVEKVIEFANQKKADLILPMWSPHSEDYRLSLECEKGNILFVGPQWEVLKIAGNKQFSCKIAKIAGLPVLPQGSAKNAQDAAKIADKIGYPVMIKADEGGGGLAMDVARSREELFLSWEKIGNKSSIYFPGTTVSIQKFIEKAAHLEVQVAGDKKGNVLHLGMRNCSYQLQRQKRIEESHGIIDGKKRKYIYDMAVLFGKYLSSNMGHIILGTVEFIIDENGNAYFIEMNGRIQVEHRVTEQAVGHGLDLVRLQIALSMGESLLSIFPGGQEEIDAKLREGRWAIEARIYAEEPGIIEEAIFPEETKDLIIDTHIYRGCEISPYFVSHLVNVIALGIGERAREEAAELLLDTLVSIKIKGVKTNISKQIKALMHPDFTEGHYSTELYPQIVEEYVQDNEKEMAAAIGVSVALALEEQKYESYIRQIAGPSAWKLAGYIESMRQYPIRP